VSQILWSDMRCRRSGNPHLRRPTANSANVRRNLAGRVIDKIERVALPQPSLGEPTEQLPTIGNNRDPFPLPPLSRETRTLSDAIASILAKEPDLNSIPKPGTAGLVRARRRHSDQQPTRVLSRRESGEGESPRDALSPPT